MRTRPRSRVAVVVVVVALAGMAVAVAVAAAGIGRAPDKSLEAAKASPVNVAPKRPAGKGPVYGPVPLGGTRYPVPAGAHFVAPDGKDSAAGTKAAPWRTVARAVSAGGTIVLRAGVYREDVVVTGRRVVLQPYPGETVWFDGSRPVTGWVRDGSMWRRDGWRTTFDNRDPNAGRTSAFRMVDPRYPMSRWPDEVFVGGRQLEQVKSRAQVKEGTFFVDYAAGRLYIGSDPSGGEVAATTLSEALFLKDANGSVVRGLGFRRYATPIKRVAAVKGFGNNLLFENNTFADTALTGLSLRGANITVRRNAFVRNGQLGLHGHKTDHLRITGNVLEGNNAAHFKIIPVAGGMKITDSTHTYIADNLARSNAGAGIWCDVNCSNTVIARNAVRDNAGHGIQFEISDKALIVGNVVVGNARYGIRVLESSRARLWNNTVAGNARRQIDAQDGGREQGGHGRLTWNVEGVQFRNNLLETRPGSDQPMGVGDATGRRRAADMVDPDGDAFYRPGGKPSSLIHWLSGTGSSPEFTTLAAFQRSTGRERHGIADNNEAPFVDRTGFRLRPGSAPLRAGLPVPGDVARHLGVRAGERAGVGAPGIPQD